MGQNVDVHLTGLLYAEPTKYWDYIQVEALLGLQAQKTTLKDEMVFIMYHQINELLFKMILWEIEQISEIENISTEKFAKHLFILTCFRTPLPLWVMEWMLINT